MSHKTCSHSKTKSARARCRKTFEFQWMNLIWNDERSDYRESVNVDLMHSASENADDTSVEHGFELASEEWYESALNTYRSLLDTYGQDGKIQ